MITIDSLTVRYGSLTALDGVTMHLAERAVHGVAGASGAGKSSLLNVLYGLVAPDGGAVSRAGHPLRRRDIAYLEGRQRFFEGLTGRDMLDMAARWRTLEDPVDAAREFRLPLDRPIAAWPAQMQRKLALLLVLTQRKPLLLLDEPFRELDTGSGLVVQELLRRRRSEGSTILLTSRELAPLEALCDDIRILDKGRITAEFRPGESTRAAKTPEETDAGKLEELLRLHGLTHFDNGKIN